MPVPTVISRFTEQLAGYHRSLLAPQAEERFDWRPAVMLLSVALSLLLIHYLKFSTVFRGLLVEMGQAGGGWAELARALLGSPFYKLYQELWWGFWHLIGYLLIPLLIIKGLFRERLRDYGLGWGRTNSCLIWYALLALLILSFAWQASLRPDFASHYPFYRLASRSWFDLLAWEAIYIVQFMLLEFFFRGYMINACRRSLGLNAIFIMAVPYLMIHFPKPWLEATGAISFGLILGFLALHSRSIWGGVMVHVSIAVGMDLMALFRADSLPRVWWPL